MGYTFCISYTAFTISIGILSEEGREEIEKGKKEGGEGGEKIKGTATEERQDDMELELSSNSTSNDFQSVKSEFTHTFSNIHNLNYAEYNLNENENEKGYNDDTSIGSSDNQTFASAPSFVSLVDDHDLSQNKYEIQNYLITDLENSEEGENFLPSTASSGVSTPELNLGKMGVEKRESDETITIEETVEIEEGRELKGELDLIQVVLQEYVQDIIEYRTHPSLSKSSSFSSSVSVNYASLNKTYLVEDTISPEPNTLICDSILSDSSDDDVIDKNISLPTEVKTLPNDDLVCIEETEVHDVNPCVSEHKPRSKDASYSSSSSSSTTTDSPSSANLITEEEYEPELYDSIYDIKAGDVDETVGVDDLEDDDVKEQSSSYEPEMYGSFCEINEEANEVAVDCDFVYEPENYDSMYDINDELNEDGEGDYDLDADLEENDDKPSPAETIIHPEAFNEPETKTFDPTPKRNRWSSTLTKLKLAISLPRTPEADAADVEATKDLDIQLPKEDDYKTTTLSRRTKEDEVDGQPVWLPVLKLATEAGDTLKRMKRNSKVVDEHVPTVTMKRPSILVPHFQSARELEADLGEESDALKETTESCSEKVKVRVERQYSSLYEDAVDLTPDLSNRDEIFADPAKIFVRQSSYPEVKFPVRRTPSREHHYDTLEELQFVPTPEQQAKSDEEASDNKEAKEVEVCRSLDTDVEFDASDDEEIYENFDTELDGGVNAIFRASEKADELEGHVVAIIDANTDADPAITIPNVQSHLEVEKPDRIVSPCFSATDYEDVASVKSVNSDSPQLNLGDSLLAFNELGETKYKNRKRRSTISKKMKNSMKKMKNSVRSTSKAKKRRKNAEGIFPTKSETDLPSPEPRLPYSETSDVKSSLKRSLSRTSSRKSRGSNLSVECDLSIRDIAIEEIYVNHSDQVTSPIIKFRPEKKDIFAEDKIAYSGAYENVDPPVKPPRSPDTPEIKQKNKFIIDALRSARRNKYENFDERNKSKIKKFHDYSDCSFEETSTFAIERGSSYESLAELDDQSESPQRRISEQKPPASDIDQEDSIKSPPPARKIVQRTSSLLNNLIYRRRRTFPELEFEDKEKRATLPNLHLHIHKGKAEPSPHSSIKEDKEERSPSPEQQVVSDKWEASSSDFLSSDDDITEDDLELENIEVEEKVKADSGLKNNKSSIFPFGNPPMHPKSQKNNSKQEIKEENPSSSSFATDEKDNLWKKMNRIRINSKPLSAPSIRVKSPNLNPIMMENFNYHHPTTPVSIRRSVTSKSSTSSKSSPSPKASSKQQASTESNSSTSSSDLSFSKHSHVENGTPKVNLSLDQKLPNVLLNENQLISRCPEEPSPEKNAIKQSTSLQSLADIEESSLPTTPPTGTLIGPFEKPPKPYFPDLVFSAMRKRTDKASPERSVSCEAPNSKSSSSVSVEGMASMKGSTPKNKRKSVYATIGRGFTFSKNFLTSISPTSPEKEKNEEPAVPRSRTSSASETGSGKTFTLPKWKKPVFGQTSSLVYDKQTGRFVEVEKASEPEITSVTVIHDHSALKKVKKEHLVEVSSMASSYQLSMTLPLESRTSSTSSNLVKLPSSSSASLLSISSSSEGESMSVQVIHTGKTLPDKVKHPYPLSLTTTSPQEEIRLISPSPQTRSDAEDEHLASSSTPSEADPDKRAIEIFSHEVDKCIILDGGEKLI